MKPIFTTCIAGFDITLFRSGKRYRVVYGEDTYEDLEEFEASRALGSCILHATKLL